MKKISVSIVMLLVAAMGFTSCVKQKIDNPPDMSQYDPNIPVTHSIAQLKAINGKYKGGDDTTVISQDITVSGIVTADDRSGNYYKQIVIEDTSGAIAVNIDAYSLYNDYPVGRKIYIKCKGLVLGYYGGLPTLGGSFDEQLNINGISGNQIEPHIVKGDVGHVITPVSVTMSQVKSFSPTNAANQQLLNRLITITDAEFADGELGKTYTDPTASTNRNLQDCSGSTIVLRSSNYANFHAITVPGGHGAVTGIYTVYSSSGTNWTPQLIIRDTTDVKFYNLRCDGSTGNYLFKENFETISTTSGTPVSLTGWTNFAQNGSIQYTGATFGGTKFAKISAFGSGQATVTTWLVTPGITLPGNGAPKLSFQTIDGYDNGATLKVFVSTDFSGSGNPSTATWTPLTATVSSGHTAGYGPAWVNSGNIDLSAYVGKKVYVAFRYDGGDPSKTTTFELDNVKVTGN